MFEHESFWFWFASGISVYLLIYACMSTLEYGDDE